MTLKFELDLDRVKGNKHANYLGQPSSKVILFKSYCPDTHTQWSDCSTWTTEVAGNYHYKTAANTANPQWCVLVELPAAESRGSELTLLLRPVTLCNTRTIRSTSTWLQCNNRSNLASAQCHDGRTTHAFNKSYIMPDVLFASIYLPYIKHHKLQFIYQSKPPFKLLFFFAHEPGLAGSACSKSEPLQ